MMSNLIKIESSPDLVERVYANLLDAISDGTLAPGARITQEDIADQLAVSRQPVLQALRLLRKDGFVLDAPGRGVLVAPLDVTKLNAALTLIQANTPPAEAARQLGLGRSTIYREMRRLGINRPA